MNKEMKNELKMYMSNGWDVKEETPEYVEIKRSKATTGTHLLIALFLGWWTFFIPNIIYHFISKETKKIYK